MRPPKLPPKTESAAGLQGVMHHLPRQRLMRLWLEPEGTM